MIDDISEFVFLFAGKKQHYIGLFHNFLMTFPAAEMLTYIFMQKEVHYDGQRYLNIKYIFSKFSFILPCTPGCLIYNIVKDMFHSSYCLNFKSWADIGLTFY